MTKRKLILILIRALLTSYFPKRSSKRKLQSKFITPDIELKFFPSVTFEIGEWYIIAMNLMDVRVEEGHGFITKIEAGPIKISVIGEQPFGKSVIGEIHAKVGK